MSACQQFLRPQKLESNDRIADLFYANVVGTTMSSTGFVTFLDLTTVATAVSTPLTHKPNVLKTKVAPEPRDIRWKSAHRLEKMLLQSFSP